MKRFLPVFPLAALLMSTMGAGPCDSTPLGSTDGGAHNDGGAQSCGYGGKTYVSGATFPSSDGCNSCGCTDGSVGCTTRACALDASVDVSLDAPTDGPANCFDANGNLVACPTDEGIPDAGIPCSYQGKVYPAGSTFPSYDGCNSCSCAGSQVVCTEKACADAGPPIDATVDGPPACTPGADQTCNEDPTVNSLRGKCLADGTCACGTNAVSPYTGRCLNPGDKTGDGCEYAGVLQPVGSGFPCADGCNKCGCISQGRIGMTLLACFPDAGGPTCSLDAVYVYGDTGGLVRYSDQVTLTPPASYVFVRTGTTGGSCGPAFPACGQPGEIDVSDVMNDIADPTVRLLLSLTVGQPTPTLLGFDSRPVDGSVFAFKRGDGAGFLVGQPCGGQTGCTAIPAAVAKLVADLRALDQLQLKDPSCLAFTAKQ
jgi:hypothetical protein